MGELNGGGAGNRKSARVWGNPDARGAVWWTNPRTGTQGMWARCHIPYCRNLVARRKSEQFCYVHLGEFRKKGTRPSRNALKALLRICDDPLIDPRWREQTPTHQEYVSHDQGGTGQSGSSAAQGQGDADEAFTGVGTG